MTSEAPSEHLFPVGLTIFTASVLLVYLVGMSVFLRYNHNHLEAINNYHFPLVERNAINVRLSESIQDLREDLLDRYDQQRLIESYVTLVETLEQNLLQTQERLLKKKHIEVDLIKQREDERKMEEKFLYLIKEQKFGEAKDLLDSEEFEIAKQKGSTALLDYAEQSSEERDHFLEQLSRLSSFVIFCSVLVLAMVIALGLKIYNIYLTNLNRRNHLQKELEVERARLDQQSRLAALGEMAAGVAHEINNPLTIFSLHLRSMDKLLQNMDHPPEKFFENIEKCRQNIDRIAKIINGLKLFSRDSSADAFEKCQIGKIVGDALDVTEAKQRKFNVNVSTSLPQGDFPLMAQPIQLTQVLTNLISNSIDAIENLSEKWIRVNASKSEKGIIISVTDSGHGIPDEVAQKILDPFFTTKEINRGTGLGLSLSSQMIKRHGGSLYYNKLSPNTEFIIELPLNPRDQNK